MRSYYAAEQETQEKELKQMFGKFASNSQHCNDELISEIKHMGGENLEGNRFDRFFQYWNEVKTALLNKNKNALLNCCAYSESSVLETYNNVLSKEIDYLTIEQHKMIYKQYVLVKHDYEEVKGMQNMLQLEHA